MSKKVAPDGKKVAPNGQKSALWDPPGGGSEEQFWVPGGRPEGVPEHTRYRVPKLSQNDPPKGGPKMVQNRPKNGIFGTCQKSAFLTPKNGYPGGSYPEKGRDFHRGEKIDFL